MSCVRASDILSVTFAPRCVAAKLMTSASRTIFDGRKGLSALAGWQGRRERTEGKPGRRLEVDQLQVGSLTFRSLTSRERDRGWRRRRGNGKKYALRFRLRGGNWRSYTRAGEGRARKLFITLSFRANSRVARDETTRRRLSSCNFSPRDSAIRFR